MFIPSFPDKDPVADSVGKTLNPSMQDPIASYNFLNIKFKVYSFHINTKLYAKYSIAIFVDQFYR